MSMESDPQRQVLEESLDFLELPPEEAGNPEDARQWLEALASLPYELDPVAPRPEVRQELLEKIDPSPSTAAGPKMPPLRTAEFSPSENALPVEAASPRSTPALVSPFQRWLPALAAGWVFALLGVVLFLAYQNHGQQQTIDSLVASLDQRADQQIELERLRYQLVDFEQRFNMITTVAAGLYPLRSPRPVSREEGEVLPRGVMYVCSNHQQWYLHLQNLEPSREGQTYYLWFLTDEGPVQMDSFRVEEFGQTVQLRRPSMPPHTRGVLVSLQDLGEPTQPAGSVVLRGDRSVKL